MTINDYIKIRDEIEDTILMDMMNSVPFFDDVYSDEVVQDVYKELFGAEDKDFTGEDRIARYDAIRGVLIEMQFQIDDMYTDLTRNMDDYEEAESEDEMAEWVDSSYLMPVWPVVRRAVRRYWKNFKEETK